MAIRCRSEAVLLVLLLALGGCKAGQEAPLPPVGEQRMALEAAACAERGGRWMGSAAARSCVMPMKDAGKACRTGADCEGECLARSLTCAPLRPLLGCNEIVLASGLRVNECVE